MLPTSLKNEAIAAITEAAGVAPTLIDTHVERIDRLAADLDLTLEKVSDTLYVARDLDEEDQKFDFWLFCKFGDKHVGQTITAVVLKS